MSDAALRELYETSYPRLVSVVGLVVGDRAEAEDLVQDAFARLVPRWSAVSAYDDPEAWVRRAALRLASNRLRKLRNGRTAYRRHGPPDDVPGVHGDAVDVSRALGALPLAQRQVVVLHHLLGLDVAQVAAELRIPVGTVKSRLSRSRAALAPLLQEETTSA